MSKYWKLKKKGHVLINSFKQICKSNQIFDVAFDNVAVADYKRSGNANSFIMLGFNDTHQENSYNLVWRTNHYQSLSFINFKIHFHKNYCGMI